MEAARRQADAAAEQQRAAEEVARQQAVAAQVGITCTCKLLKSSQHLEAYPVNDTLVGLELQASESRVAWKATAWLL